MKYQSQAKKKKWKKKNCLCIMEDGIKKLKPKKYKNEKVKEGKKE